MDPQNNPAFVPFKDSCRPVVHLLSDTWLIIGAYPMTVDISCLPLAW